jgi:hypothetical protein
MEREVIDVQLTPEERALIFQHGYPFERIERALAACDDAKIEVDPLGPFELEWLIGDLSISINDMPAGTAQDQLLELCERLEYAERTGDGMLYEF